MAITNLSIESAINDNSECSMSYEELAEQFFQLYWTQTLPFSHQDDDSVLKQSNVGKQAKVVTNILKLQQETKNTSIRIARTRDIKKWQSTIKEVAQTIKNNPAKYLQSAQDKVSREFLYVYNPKANAIVLMPGIAYCFTRFSRIIHKLCQQYWTEFVRKNRHNQP